MSEVDVSSSELILPNENTDRHRQSRQEYEARRRTFSTSTYFGKPECLSPIILARFGWRNVDRDMLECESCKATLSICLPPELSPDSHQRLVKMFQNQISEAHKQACAFRGEAQAYQLSQADVPFQIINILPREEAHILERADPQTLLAPIWKECLAMFHSRKTNLHIPDDVKEYHPPNHDNSGERNDVLLSKASDLIRRIANEPTEIDRNLSDFVTALVLLGWRNLDRECCQCLVCGAQLALFSSKSDILSSHRYYCPYICGCRTLIKSNPPIPLWQLLMKRICSESTPLANQEQDGNEDAWVETYRLLMSGISCKRKRSTN